MKRYPLIVFVVLLVAVPVLGQPRFEIDWGTVDDGGEMFSESSPSGRFELSCTIGQPDTGELSDTRFDLTGGFWNVCRASSPPRHDPAPDPVEIDEHGTKNRYLSFVAGDPGRSQAVQVTFADLTDFPYASGRVAWVQEPYLVTEASGSSGPIPPPTMWAAELGCQPFYADWTVYDTVHVIDPGIVPRATYEVRVVDSSCAASESHGYSDPLVVRTSRVGDLVGNDLVPPPSAPQGVVDFNDITAVVEKFKNEPDAPRKARADLINSDITQALPDKKVDFVDVSYCVDAFRNQAAPLPGPPMTDPCPP